MTVPFRPMQPEDVEFAAACTSGEGWTTETREEFEGFLAFHPQGCRVIFEGRQRLGIGVATLYGECGFIGELIVSPERRGRV